MSTTVDVLPNSPSNKGTSKLTTRGKERMKKVHFSLQGKGGVGKSYVASLLAQYHQDKKFPVACIDADPVNFTLSGYKALDAQRLNLMQDGALVERNFDQMMERIVATDSHFIVDSGAPTFLPLSNYLIENDAFRILDEAGKTSIVHVVIAGGQALEDTLLGLARLSEQLPVETELVVWLNEYFGLIHADGKNFEQMKVYEEYRHRITALVRIPQQTSTTFGTDVREMLERRLTFSEIESHEHFGLMARQRLVSVKRAIFEQLALVTG
jgi:hypothetical protein